MNKTTEVLLYFWRGALVMVMCLFFIGLSEVEFPFASLFGVGLSSALAYWLAKKSGADKNWAILYGAALGFISWIYYVLMLCKESDENKKSRLEEHEENVNEHIRGEILADQEEE